MSSLDENQKIAIIGLGNIGKTIATNLIRSGYSVTVAAQTIDSAEKVALQLGPKAIPNNVSEAIKSSNIVILAVWFNVIKDIVSENAALFKTKIVIDPSNPIIPDGNGGFNKIIGAQESAGQLIKDMLPRDVKFVKAFGTLSADTLRDFAFSDPKKVLFYATDDDTVGEVVEELIGAVGFLPYRVGGLDKSIDIEVSGKLHEFGDVGKALTLAEVDKLNI